MRCQTYLWEDTSAVSKSGKKTKFISSENRGPKKSPKISTKKTNSQKVSLKKMCQWTTNSNKKNREAGKIGHTLRSSQRHWPECQSAIFPEPGFNNTHAAVNRPGTIEMNSRGRIWIDHPGFLQRTFRRMNRYKWEQKETFVILRWSSQNILEEQVDEFAPLRANRARNR